MGAQVWKSASLVAKYLEGVRGAIPLAAEQLDVMLRLIQAAGKPPTNFLDLGCGDGVLSAAIVERWPGAAGVLLDFSEPMLEAACERFSGCQARLDFRNSDYGQPHWIASVRDRGPFDVVVSGFSIHHQPDSRKRELYAEIFTLLTPGGVFLNIEHVSSPSGWIESVFDGCMADALYRNHQERGSRLSRDQVAQEYYHRPDKAANILASVEDQCRWLREIGFVDVDCSLKIFELAVFGGRAATMKLANGERDVVDIRKLREYCLN